MKKILTMLVALFATVSFATAQTVESGNNWFIGINGGAVAPLTHAFDLGNHGFQAYRPLVGAEIGAYVTPVVGLSVTGDGYINTTGANRWIDQSVVSGNLKFNLSNFLAGYSGQPRRVEFVAAFGMGWGHNYGNIDGESVVGNYMTTKAGAEVNFNLGKARAWQLTIRPEVVWGDWGKTGLDSRNAVFQLKAGFVYKFNSRKNAKKSHNFVIPEPVTVEVPVEKVVEKQVVTEKVVEKVVEKDAAVRYVVFFDTNSSELSNDAKTVLDAVTAGATVDVVGYADAPGTVKYNQALSEKRAETVANYLTNRGLKVQSTTAHGETGAIVARVVVVEKK